MQTYKVTFVAANKKGLVRESVRTVKARNSKEATAKVRQAVNNSGSRWLYEQFTKEQE